MKRMISSRHEKDGLYYLDLGEHPSSVLSATNPFFQWHSRSGHPSLAKLY